MTGRRWTRMLARARADKDGRTTRRAMGGRFSHDARILSAVALAIALALLPAQPGLAQSTTPPPIFPAVDGNGVDVVRGTFNTGSTDVVIGQPGAGGLAFSWQVDGTSGGFRHDWHGYVVAAYPTYTVVIGAQTETFTASGSYPNYTFTPDQATGSTLALGSGPYGATYTYTPPDGLIYTLSWVGLTSITYPNGESVTLHHLTGSYSWFEEWPCYCWHETVYSRLQAVTNNFGYQLHLEYDASDWYKLVSVRGINMAVDWCDPLAETCSGFTETWPVATYVGGWRPTSVTDALGRTVSYAYDGAGRVTEVQFPDHADHDIAIAYYTSGDHEGRVSSVDRGFGTWSYAYSDASGVRTTTITDPDSKVTTVKSDIATGRITEVTDPLGRTTSYQYDGSSRPTRVTAPEGNYVEYDYDDRGNVIENRAVAKPGSSLDDIVTTASYPTSCSSPVTCNQPTSITDARGYRTDYTYDSTHGGVLTITAPNPDPGVSAPGQSGDRPQTRFTYAQHQARYKNGASTWTNGAAVWRLVETSACVVGMSCDATANETLTTIAYPSSSTPNNLLPSSITAAAGNGAVSSTTAATYTPQGDVKTVDGPLSGSADTTRFYYDAARQLTGVVGPDPDGGGALKFRAVRTTYNSAGLPTVVERGTTTNQGVAAFSTFALLEKQERVYDSFARPIATRLWNGSTIVALTQMSYDVVGRPRCSAARMNPASFAAPPADACTLATAGTFGPDRISRTLYDAAGQVASVQSAYGTGLQQTMVANSYTHNGLVDYFDDASGNRTDLTYDGFDRLVRTNFPVTTVGAYTADGSDYEQITFDAFGRVTQTRRRDGSVFAYSTDNLGRLTFTDAPGSDPDVTTAYDLFSRVTSISQSGNTITTAHDQLSRVASVTSSVLGTVTYQHDAAGRRTRMTWPDSFYVDYDYDVAGAVTKIRENGASSGVGVLATYAYDDLGRRTSLTRGNGVVTSYAFDAVSRLATLTQNPAGTSHDDVRGFSYSPASQITSRTRTNSAFDWIVPASSTTSYADNGLDQYTAVGSVTPTYDARGNLTSDGAKTYGYDARNRLTSASGGVSLAYDPLGRLHQVAGASTTRFLYDGADAIAELNTSGTVLRRIVHGPGTDEPLVWYEGAGTSDRRFLIADERGSIVAVSNSSGTVTNVNTYDEYGASAPGNVGRFQYTGQMWIAEAGVYHYKARAYHPGLGRFLQTDPIGVAGGMNLYAYVGGDPINATDPSGLVSCTGSHIGGRADCGGMPGFSCSGACGEVGGAFGVPMPGVDPSGNCIPGIHCNPPGSEDNRVLAGSKQQKRDVTGQYTKPTTVRALPLVGLDMGDSLGRTYIRDKIRANPDDWTPVMRYFHSDLKLPNASGPLGRSWMTIEGISHPDPRSHWGIPDGLAPGPNTVNDMYYIARGFIRNSDIDAGIVRLVPAGPWPPADYGPPRSPGGGLEYYIPAPIPVEAIVKAIDVFPSSAF